ncbi:MAG: hypothetical protein UT30_C0026G0002 [Candidatus Uhrbacteria bacterium GW2011_GWF2_39_13]|uniref:Carbohydrate-binding domain-containing protein n=1 Tax=Candidatus Uhrbacteria bacterium GW2011_GWF2_39_13 TaxID=1618995 RepID=A0A0G0QPG1_9BACT|nr:MAG: hypothetical protein UT30_C0026G0002 [Candidatus Uhrbacteria bacterium GW2011_GWF2_39_13]
MSRSKFRSMEKEPLIFQRVNFCSMDIARGIITVISVICLSFSSFAISLVKDGKPEAVIVIPPKASDAVIYAAKELQTYLKKISGAELQIMNSVPEKTDKTLIYVGYDEVLKSKGLDLSGLGYDGFKIISGERWLALFGRDYNGKPMEGRSHPFRMSESYSGKLKISRYGETGILFAVYNFLEKFCGARWYMPGELGEVLPNRKTLEIPEKIAISKTPDFEYRFLYNCDFCDDDDSVLWYRRAGFGAPFPVNINHSFYILCRKYKDTNPEYFALVDGKRDFSISCGGRGNLCLSNPDVLKAFVKEAREYFDTNPEQYIFPVMPNDGLVKICECPECQKQIDKEKGNTGKFSNYIWNFVNKVAKEVYKSHPDKFIGCCAYRGYLDIPDKLEKLSPNVVVMICKTRRNYWDTEYKKRYNEMIENWNNKIKQGNLYCWEYYIWVSYVPYLRNVPVVFPRIIAEDFKFLRGKSKGDFIEAQTWVKGAKQRKACFPGLTHLNFYVTAKLMWDTDTDINRLLDEYYSFFYGPASAEMKKFWEKAQELWSRDLPGRDNEFYTRLYTVQEIDGLMKFLREARAKTVEGSSEQKRVDLIISEVSPLESRVKNAKLTENPSCICQEISSAPKIDGVPDDQCWKDIVPMEFVSKTGETVPYASKLMICFDDKNLYLFFTNYIDAVEQAALKSLCKEKDSNGRPYIWEDESVEIFLNPTPGVEKNYYQFAVNAGGTLWDGYYGYKALGRTPSEWNSGIETAVKRNVDSWTLEAKIPIADIGLAGKDLEKITMTGNFVRNRSEKNTIHYSCWSPTMTSSHHNPAKFGTITLKKKSTEKIIDDENEKYGIEDAGFPGDFAKAYRIFLSAKAGDNDLYSMAAIEFQKTSEMLEKDIPTQLSSLSLEALCHFLSLDIEKASSIADKALPIARRKYPGDVLFKAPDKLKDILNPGTEQKRIRDLAGLLYLIAQTEKETFALGEKLRDKINFRLTRIDLKNGWEHVALVLALLLDKSAPSLLLIEEKARQAVCASNLRQLGVLLFLYAQERDGKLPPSWSAASKTTWMAELLKQQKNPWSKRGSVFRCPSLTEKGEDGFHYGMNSNFTGNNDVSKISRGNKILLLSDSVHYNIGNYPHKPDYSGGAFSLKGPYESTGGGTVDRCRHMGGANVLFSDGSVEWLQAKQIPANRQDTLWKN